MSFRNWRIAMAHAVVLQVKLLGGDPEEGQKMLDDLVVPNAKAQAGFQSGIWMRTAETSGMGVVVFDTEANAAAAQPALNPPPGGPELISSTVYEVGAQA
jgi:hypothetical protein